MNADRRRTDRARLIGLIGWLVAGVLLVTGADRLLGETGAALVGLVYLGALPFFMEAASALLAGD